MKKYKMNMRIEERFVPSAGSVLLKMSPVEGSMPEIAGGQFVNILVPDAPGAFLRRPISVCNVADGKLWLFIKDAGKGTARLCSLKEGDVIDIVLPLGHGFSLPQKAGSKALLIGGGVGIAPLLYWGRILKDNGFEPSFLLGAATASALTLLDEFRAIGQVHITTDDGSAGTKGTVMCHPVMTGDAPSADVIYCCGPTPMMKAVGRYAIDKGVQCEVSLENHMACGIGACLCCVENTKAGHKCVCTEGPVFNINDLDWV